MGSRPRSTSSRKSVDRRIEELQAKLRKDRYASTGREPINVEQELEESRAHVRSIERKVRLKGKRVLDLGSGTGQKALAMAEHASFVHGVEPQKQEHEMSLLKQEYFGVKNVRFYLAGAERLPLDDASVDVITSETVLEHVQDVEKTMAESARVLRKKGKLYLMCPNYLWIYEGHYHLYMLPYMPRWMFKVIARLTGRDPAFIDSINYTTPRLVRRLLADNGFRITRDFSAEALRSLLVSGRPGKAAKTHPAFSRVAGALRAVGLGRIVYGILMGTGLYPVIDLAAEKD